MKDKHLNLGDVLFLEGKEYMVVTCPTCQGLAIALNDVPTKAYSDWAHKKSCQSMIEYLEKIGQGSQITAEERTYAYGEAA